MDKSLVRCLCLLGVLMVAVNAQLNGGQRGPKGGPEASPTFGLLNQWIGWYPPGLPNQGGGGEGDGDDEQQNAEGGPLAQRNFQAIAQLRQELAALRQEMRAAHKSGGGGGGGGKQPKFPNYWNLFYGTFR